MSKRVVLTDANGVCTYDKVWLAEQLLDSVKASKPAYGLPWAEHMALQGDVDDTHAAIAPRNQ